MRKLSTALEEIAKEPWNFPGCALYLSTTTFEALRDECKAEVDPRTVMPPVQNWAFFGMPLVIDDEVPGESFELRKSPKDVPIQRGTVFAPNDVESE